MNDPAVYDPRREPFAEPGIDPRVVGRALAAGANPATGERLDQRTHGPGADVSRRPWPPPSRGPLPPPDAIPDDLNIFTAQDEIDAWAHEHDAATNLLARHRRALAGDDDDDGIEIKVMRARARHRRVARANPTERGRRTSADIDAEVDENLANDPNYHRKLDLEASVEIALGRLFRAKDNIHRLQRYIDSLPRVSDRI
ncbi:MAG: hypothetical protein ABR616_09990 [Dermatophilaceae bacterium]